MGYAGCSLRMWEALRACIGSWRRLSGGTEQVCHRVAHWRVVLGSVFGGPGVGLRKVLVRARMKR